MDRAYAGDETRQMASDLGFKRVAPLPKSRVAPWEYDREEYKQRNEEERLFCRLKGYRRVFTRYDKLDGFNRGLVLFVTIVEALRSVNTP